MCKLLPILLFAVVTSQDDLDTYLKHHPTAINSQVIYKEAYLQLMCLGDTLSFEYNIEHIKEKLWNYVYLNCGLEINFNKEKFHSKNGLKDFLIKKMDIEHIVYDIIHIYEPDLEITLKKESISEIINFHC